uniref:Centriolar coiled-coil protein 110 n=1 Tax=Salarias fasciatus TaxID=181472 RepID=A0A672GH22_SALFA
MGRHDHLAAGFRRRCHTLDSQLHTYGSGVEHVDRSQERVPRFMAGVTLLAPSRRPPSVPLNQSFEVETPSPTFRRPCVTPEFAHVAPRMELSDSQGLSNDRKTPTALRSTAETQTDKTGESLHICNGKILHVWILFTVTEETQWRAHALEDMRRRLDEEHALQMSLLLAEQEKEQHRLHLVSFPIPSAVTSPSVQSPVYLWGSSRCAVGLKPLLLSCSCGDLQVLTAEQQRAFCHIGAIVRGFLTRRLLKTEKLKHLRQTVVDTQEFIRSFQTEASQKRGIYSAQDLSLQERVRAQLRAALYDIHDIFFEMPLVDRLALLQQERELRAERKLRDMVTRSLFCGELISSLVSTVNIHHRIPNLNCNVLLRRKTKATRREWFFLLQHRVLKPSQGQNSPLTGQLNLLKFHIMLFGLLSLIM